MTEERIYMEDTGCNVRGCGETPMWRIDAWTHSEQGLLNFWSYTCSEHLRLRVLAYECQVLVKPMDRLVPDLPMVEAAAAMIGGMGEGKAWIAGKDDHECNPNTYPDCEYPTP